MYMWYSNILPFKHAPIISTRENGIAFCWYVFFKPVAILKNVEDETTMSFLFLQ
jgi:hypothetical protein